MEHLLDEEHVRFTRGLEDDELMDEFEKVVIALPVLPNHDYFQLSETDWEAFKYLDAVKAEIMRRMGLKISVIVRDYGPIH